MSTDTLAPAVSRVQRIRHEIKRRELTVLRVESPTPHTRRITLGGESLSDFISASFDDHIKLILGDAAGEPVRRDYTPRHFDTQRRELSIEFALHGDGPAAQWSANAQPGDTAVVAGPRGSLVIPTDFDWHLLIGDETALPAIARRLEELPRGTRAIVIGLTDDVADRREFRTAAALTLHWVDSADALVNAVHALVLPEGEGYAWCAGEASTMATLRRILVEDKGVPRQAIRAAAYWKRGASAHHEHIED
ncbi:siderophore-interacting protein [Piscinibacter terrae]|uniref:Siderophore-interacting protein n=1 Tax=Piscinibacter terrae TaxID=2496871 RepID=A0A3N7HJQ9_9BURK|nr:siderophore-interacting protein [Albitalea terrae]RQP22298.1 siderophore-interacting protein [Albitalea terrae]